MMGRKSIYYFLGLAIAVVALWVSGASKKSPISKSALPSQPQPAHDVEAMQWNAAVDEVVVASASTETQETAANSVSHTEEGEPTEPTGFGTNRLKIADREFTVLFEASEVSDSLKRDILNDIELNLSHLDHISLRPLEADDPGQVFRSTVTHVLDEGRQERLFPSVLEEYFGGAMLTESTSQLVIHEKLVQAYEQAVKYRRDHPVMFQKLATFLEQLKDKDFIAQIENQKDIAQRFIVFDVQPSSSYDYGRELSGLLKHGDIRSPSLLDFSNVVYKGEDAVRFSTVIGWPESMSSEPFTKGFPQFIYWDEEWRIFVPEMM